jgi:hypothetical protein
MVNVIGHWPRHWQAERGDIRTWVMRGADFYLVPRLCVLCYVWHVVRVWSYRVCETIELIHLFFIYSSQYPISRHMISHRNGQRRARCVGVSRAGARPSRECSTDTLPSCARTHTQGHIYVSVIANAHRDYRATTARDLWPVCAFVCSSNPRTIYIYIYIHI